MFRVAGETETSSKRCSAGLNTCVTVTRARDRPGVLNRPGQAMAVSRRAPGILDIFRVIWWFPGENPARERLSKPIEGVLDLVLRLAGSRPIVTGVLSR